MESLSLRIARSVEKWERETFLYEKMCESWLECMAEVIERELTL